MNASSAFNLTFSRRCWLTALGLLLCASRGICLPANADEPAKPSPSEVKQEKGKEEAGPRFLRVQRNAEGQVATLETAVVRYQPAAKKPDVVVDLIGVVHIADKAYYDKLNELFTGYDAVLYELVMQEGVQLPKPGEKSREGGHPVSAMQKTMKSMLELDFQLDRVDYRKPNFIHADMTAEEFSKSMQDRGEGLVQIFFRMLGQGAAMQGSKGAARGSDINLLSALFAKDRAVQLKRAMAEQFDSMESQVALFEGPEGSTLITERNKKALAVLDRELKAGKKRLAIFYGAGHLPDLEQRLLTDFQFKRTGEQWLTAWTIVAKPKSP